MPEPVVDKGDFTKFLTDTYRLIQTHGLDGGMPRKPGEVRLRLREAMKIALGHSQHKLIMSLPFEDRILVSAAWAALEPRMEEFYPPNKILSVWADEDATTEQVLALLANVLHDYGVSP